MVFLNYIYYLHRIFFCKFDQFKVPTIKFGKCFAEFMIPIASLKEFGSLEFVTIIEVINMGRCSGKANELRYIYYSKFDKHQYLIFVTRVP